MDGRAVKKVDKNYIEYICSLAKLEFTEEEYYKVHQRLKGFDEYAEKLAEIDTSNIQPLVNSNETTNFYREDIVKPSLDRNIILENALDSMYGCIKVKKIIE